MSLLQSALPKSAGTFSKATECTSLMTSHCSVLLLEATHNESGIFSHGFQLDVQFINILWCGCQWLESHTVLSSWILGSCLFISCYRTSGPIFSSSKCVDILILGHQMMVQMVIRSFLFNLSLFTSEECWKPIRRQYGSILDFVNSYMSEWEVTEVTMTL